jgi:hypothetical protein
MTEADWRACDDRQALQAFLRGKASDRKLRLFAVACCRSIWQHLLDERSRYAVEVAERFADGLVTDSELLWATLAGYEYAKRLRKERWAAYAAWNVADDQGGALGAAVSTAWNAGQFGEAIGLAERVKQYGLIHCIMRNYSPPLPPAVLRWHDGTARRLAQAIYDVRDMPAGTLDTARLAVLADALLDAGCEDEGLLAHLRSEGPHVRGCWAVDVILGRS